MHGPGTQFPFPGTRAPTIVSAHSAGVRPHPAAANAAAAQMTIARFTPPS